MAELRLLQRHLPRIHLQGAAVAATHFDLDRGDERAVQGQRLHRRQPGAQGWGATWAKWTPPPTETTEIPPPPPPPQQEQPAPMPPGHRPSHSSGTDPVNGWTWEVNDQAGKNFCRCLLTPMAARLWEGKGRRAPAETREARGHRRQKRLAATARRATRKSKGAGGPGSCKRRARRAAPGAKGVLGQYGDQDVQWDCRELINKVVGRYAGQV